MNTRHTALSAALATVCLATAGLALAAGAPQKIPGEKWKQTMSMEAGGMRMPATSMEICLPKDKGTEAASRPPEMDQSNCSIYDMKQSGNTFSAKVRCTGEDAMEGEFETTVLGPDHVSGQMRARREGMDMLMKYESKKLGGACEAIEFESFATSAQAAPDPLQDICGPMGEQLGRGGSALAAAAPFYVGEQAQCGKHASRKTYCDAVQTHAGFYQLDRSERAMAGVTDARGNPDSLKPLGSSLSTCGLGGGDTAVLALKSRLLGTAEQSRQWWFVFEYGDAAAFQRLSELAKAQCSGRSFTSAANASYASLCSPYGAALVRGDHEAVRQIVAGNGASASVDAVMPASATIATPEQPAPSPTDKTLDRGKRLLRGILGN